MKLIIIAGICLAGLATSVQTHVPGTCASIGYSTACCPPSLPEKDCRASDGDCFCNSDCHIFGDCCEDVYCPSQPRTCADVGITSCCSDMSGAGLCDVHFQDTQESLSHCSCNVTCHLRNDCCSDAVEFCIPQTCTDAGKNAGFCVWSSTKSCYVPGGRCYCDCDCTDINIKDCCDDVPLSVNCRSSQQDRSRVQSDLEQNLRASNMLGYNEKDHRFRTQTQYTYREPQTAHAQRPRVNAREYRARARSQRGG